MQLINQPTNKIIMTKQNTIIFGDIVTGEQDFFGDPIEEQKVDETKQEEKTETTEKEVTEIPIKKEEGKDEEESDEDLFGDKIDEESIEKVEKQSDAKSGKVDYLQRVKDLVEQGIFYDFEELSEIESLTKEEYEEIKAQQILAQKEELKEEVLSGLSEDEKEFLDYKKSGGNLEAYTKSFLNKDRLQKIDLSTDNGKKAVIYEYYTRVDGYSSEKAQKRIALLEKEMELDDEAQMLHEKLAKQAEDEHNILLKKQQDYIDSIKKAEEDYKEGIKETLKSEGVDSKNSAKIIKTLTERDERGFTPIDKAFLSLRNDPKKSKFLYDILMDFDTFKNSLEKETKTEAALNTLKTIKFKQKRTSTDVAENDNKNVITL